MYASIIVDISHEKLDKTFEYEIPKELEGQVTPGVQVRIPFGNGNRELTGYVIEIKEKSEYDPSKIKALFGLVNGSIPIEGQLIKLAAWMKRQYGGTMNQALKTVIPIKQKTRVKEKKTVRLLLSEEAAFTALTLFERKNHKARVRLLGALIKQKEIPYEVITQKLNISSSVIKALEENKMIAVDATTVYRNPVKTDTAPDYHLVLNESQNQTVDGIMKMYHEGLHKTALIHGVTGSGKTEVYMELIAKAAEKGRPSIVLIPEIALTYQTVMRFYNRFGDRVSIINSRLSAGERFDQFERAKKGEIDVMIGPRSALFTPFSKLGFIIIDEEHETTYQSENVPRFHARETAEERVHLAGGMVVLGSATPSLESYYRAKKGQYALFELNNRVSHKEMAKVHVVDLRKELEEGNRSVLSRDLHKMMAERLSRKQQIILFINRRGVSGFLSCRTCGKVIKCPHCDVSLSEHNNGKMICHYCGYEAPLATSCPSCGSKAIGGFKAGTQKMEQLVQKAFPQARILRMDFDTTREKEGHEKILSAFANQEADILIGTQMIVKGHDFPNVTLVGILAADLSLYTSDYHASERTFQLLTQAAGRAGRGSLPGDVVIQTYNPEHYSIVTAAHQNYKEFYEEEILYRQMLKYPPIWNMMVLMLSGENEQKTAKAAQTLYEKIAERNLEKCYLIGPTDPSVARVNDNYKKVIYVKAENYDTLVDIKDALELYMKDNFIFKDVSVMFDFNG